MANRDIVVIGGSAGSREPLRAIVSMLADDFKAAVVIVVHVPARSSGILTLLSSVSRLPVKQAEDGEAVLPGRIYLAPPNYHLLIIDDRFMLGTGPRENLTRPAVDALFRSAALSCGARTVGLVLSGMMNDGASGLAAIKESGGIALVQSPSDAIAPEMPLAALETTPADLVAPAAELTDAIVRFASEPPGPSQPVTSSVRLEVDIAAGRRVDSRLTKTIAEPAPFTCPECGGVLSEVRKGHPLRFRCQVGHGHTAVTLMARQAGVVEEAMRTALRIVEERATLVGRMGKNAAAANRLALANMHAERAAEYRKQADVLRAAILRGMEEEAHFDDDDAKAAEADVPGGSQSKS